MIVYYLVLGFSFLLIALFLKLTGKVFLSVAEGSVSLLDKLLENPDDDDEKIENIQDSTMKLVGALFKMFLFVLLAFALGSVPIIIYCYLNNKGYSDIEFSSFYAIVAISVGATIPFLIPSKKKSSTEYSELSKLLHRMALNNYTIANKLFKKEVKKVDKKKKVKKRNDFVIISGLARAGTTSLMNDIAKIDSFRSLSYANMPFLMAPNLWAKFYKPKQTELKERSHKDGIMIGLSSNEALEEYFFKVKANDSYISNTYLKEYCLSEEDYNDYIDYHRIIRKSNHELYLAKNNNFLLRYKSMRAFNKDFLMVILFREPLSHASSLLDKHLDYQKQQNEDNFILEYMNWLGHHEFGNNQKQFLFENSIEIKDTDKESIDYWLRVWINYYNYALTISDRNTIFVNYDDYCSKPQQVIEKVTNRLNLELKIPDLNGFNNKRKAVTNYNEELLHKANNIYNKLIG